MVKYDRSINAFLFMRVGKTADIMDSYKNDYIKFTCPANWIHYAISQRNGTIGDPYECSFANVREDDPRIDNLTDAHGRPMGNHLLVLNNKNTHTSLLCYLPVILRPTICLYSFNYDELYNKYESIGPYKDKWIKYSLDKYRSSIGYNEDEASFLFIHDPINFVRELIDLIPKTVKENADILTDERFDSSNNAIQSLDVNNVNYHIHQANELFFDNPRTPDVMYWKLPKFEWQSEIRLTMINTNFKQGNVNGIEKYDYKQNELKVYFPNFKNYATVYSAKDAHSLKFNNFKKKDRLVDFTVLPEKIKI